MAQSPVCLALIVCDAVHKDAATGKHTLLGTLSTIGARKFPAKLAKLGVYIVLTDGRGETPFSVRLIDVDEERPPVFSIDGKLNFTDPRACVEMGATVGPIAFPKAGEYRLQVYSGEELLEERRIILMSPPRKG